MKKFLCLFFSVSLILMSFASCSDDKSENQDNSNNSQGTTLVAEQNTPADSTIRKNTVHHVEMTIRNYGTVKIELYPDEAPLSVGNFIELAKSGFYDGVGFHRLDKDFVLQGGDPDGDGAGGSDKQIKGEFASNGVQNNISHKRGVISMARTPDPDSASSQFFICLEDSTFLDGNYAAFGYVTEGMNIIDEIRDTTPESDSIPKDQQPVIETIKVID
ncbi:MAG: peptidylprolyl isomerase [Acutalibacteraceae bacterium]|nr:peptidylprolyl isomerase [Acutalibacteraceae bacterium]